MSAIASGPDGTREPTSSRRVDPIWWAVIGVVVLASAVRLAGIGSRLSIDDAYSWFAASSPSPHVFLQRLADNENTPPLIYLLLMLMPGTQPAWLRLPAALPGVVICPVLFMALRPRLGNRAAALAALGVAVAPYAVTYSNLARGFMLADLALMVALWCLLSLAERETKSRWAAFVMAGTVAVYSEYRSAVVIIAMVLAALWIGAPRRRSTLVAGAIVVLTLAAWVPQIVRAQNQVGVTKFDPLGAAPSVSGVRDVLVTLTLGENGGTGSAAGRWLLFAVLLGLGGVGYLILQRAWPRLDHRARYTIRLLAGTAVLIPAGYALAAIFGIDIFTQRYLTILVPFGAALGAAAVANVRTGWVLPAAALLLIALGLGNFARRLGGEWQPDLAPVRVAAGGLHPRTVLTNTPVVLYYLSSFRPVFDRPYNLGPGRAQTCTRPCLVVDDTRVPGGTPRNAPGVARMIGPFLLVFER